MEKVKEQKKNKKKIIFFGLIGVLLILGGPIVAAIIASRIPYYTFINSAYDFNNINKRLDGYYLTTQQLFISDEPIVPIGTKEKPFTGVFEATSTNRTMRSLCTFSFSSEYIKNQFDNPEIDEVNIGLFAYNAGTIKGFFLYDIQIPDLSSYLNNEKQINFGPVACHNFGKIERCSTQTFRGSLSGNHIIAGGICAINYGSISLCSPDNNFNIETYGESFIGGIAGISKKDLKNNNIDPYIFDSSCSVSRLIVHKKEDYDLFVGGICAYAYSGTFSSCRFNGNLSLTSRENYCKQLYFGCILGFINGNVNLDHIYAKTNFSTTIFEGYFSFGIGYVESSSIVNVQSIILNSSIIISSTNNYCGYFCAKKGSNVSFNSDNTIYYYDSTLVGSSVNKDFATSSSFEDINLASLTFDVSKWSKNDSKKTLEIYIEL